MSDTVGRRATDASLEITGRRATDPPGAPVDVPVSVALADEAALEAEPADAIVDRETTLFGLDGLAERAGFASAALVTIKPTALEITRHEPDIAYWETAVIAAGQTAAPVLTDALAEVDAAALRDVVAAATPDEDGRIVFVVDPSGGLTVQGQLVAPTDQPIVPAPRPSAGSVLPTRVELPRSVPVGIALRLDGPNLLVPEDIGQRFMSRMVSLTTLYEGEGGWFMSGVVDGRPNLVIVGSVGVY